MFTWYDGESGKYNITLSWDTVLSCSHQGQCDDDVDAELADATIRQQLEQYDVDDLRKIVRGYGIEPEKLEETKDVYRYLLWIACGDIKENPEMYFNINDLPAIVTAKWDDDNKVYDVKVKSAGVTAQWWTDQSMIDEWEDGRDCDDLVSVSSEYFQKVRIRFVGGERDGETV